MTYELLLKYMFDHKLQPSQLTGWKIAAGILVRIKESGIVVNDEFKQYFDSGEEPDQWFSDKSLRSKHET